MNRSDDHPRIVLLKKQVNALPVDELYKNQLLCSIEIYRCQILERPEKPINDGWNDLEALQQVTIGDVLERSLTLIP